MELGNTGRLAAIWMAICASQAWPALAAPATLVLGYVPRPGMAEEIDGKPAGTYMLVALAAAQKSGLPFELRALPQKRLMTQVSTNQPNFCALGIYVTPERSAFARFSRPFFRDPRFIVVAAKRKEAAFRAHKTFLSLSQDPALRLGLIAGFAYGPELDPLLGQMKGNREEFVGTYFQNFGKIALGRIDYAITFPREYETVMAHSKEINAQLMRVDYPDIPMGRLRHFMCSKSVDDAVLNQINAGIGALHLDLPP